MAEDEDLAVVGAAVGAQVRVSVCCLFPFLRSVGIRAHGRVRVNLRESLGGIPVYEVLRFSEDSRLQRLKHFHGHRISREFILVPLF